MRRTRNGRRLPRLPSGAGYKTSEFLIKKALDKKSVGGVSMVKVNKVERWGSTGSEFLQMLEDQGAAYKILYESIQVFEAATPRYSWR